MIQIRSLYGKQQSKNKCAQASLKTNTDSLAASPKIHDDFPSRVTFHLLQLRK